MVMCTVQDNQIDIFSEEEIENNPFIYLESVKNSNFIGRKELLKTIGHDYIKGQHSACIVGLPRIGKSSLLNYFFDTNKRAILSNWNTLTIKIDASTVIIPEKVTYASGLKSERTFYFWKDLAQTLNNEIEYFFQLTNTDEQTQQEIRELLLQAINESHPETQKNTLEKCFEGISSKLNLKIVIGIDEFQEVEYYFDDSQFKQMKRLIENKGIVFILASRRTYASIERKVSGQSYCHFQFKHKPLCGFEEGELELYWRWAFNLFGEKIPTAKRTEYREMATYYVGSHPCYLNLFNNIAWNLINKGQINYSVDGISLLESKMYEELHEGLKGMIATLKNEKLFDFAIQLFKGPLSNEALKNRNKIEETGFLVRISPSEKFSLFNQEIGHIFEEEDGLGNVTKFSYVCMSPFFTRVFFDEYTPDLNYEQLWDYTERQKMRELIRMYLLQKFGEDAFDRIDPDNPIDYREKWQDRMHSYLISTTLPNHLSIDKWETNNEELIQNKAKQCDAFRGKKNIPLYRFLTTGQLHYIFFMYDWDKEFSRVFSLSSSDWYHKKFKPMNEFRNSLKHSGVEGITQYEIDNFMTICNEVNGNIDRFIMNGNIFGN